MLFPCELFDITFPDFQSFLKKESHHLRPRATLCCFLCDVTKSITWQQVKTHARNGYKLVFFRKQQEQLQMALSESYFLWKYFPKRRYIWVFWKSRRPLTSLGWTQFVGTSGSYIFVVEIWTCFTPVSVARVRWLWCLTNPQRTLLGKLNASHFSLPCTLPFRWYMVEP